MFKNTAVMYGSSNNPKHVNSNYPMMLVGGENLGLKHGTFHKRGDTGAPLSHMHSALLNAMDVPNT